MALLKFGAFVTDLSGKIGGTIFSKNRGGNYAKNRVVPNNPATPAQSIVRGRFGSLSSQWRTLSQEERDSFTAATGNFPKSNRIGDTIQLAGNALFVALNSARLATNLSILTSAPAAEGVTEYSIGTFILTNGGLNESIKFAGTAIDPVLADDMTVQIFATAPVSPGISNLNSKFKQIAVRLNSALTPPTEIGNAYTAVFGIPPVGTRVGLRLVPVNVNTGEQGVGVERTQIVVAAV